MKLTLKDFFEDLPKTFLELMQAASQLSPTSERYTQVVGAIALLLDVIVFQEDAERFRELMREVGLAVPTDTAKRILKTAQQGLNEEQQKWLQSQIDAILSGAIE